ncbi:uncharacterized protein STEHIDRAFT_163365 [Stereum hirsutum FP-91666 SS1]|uniref:Uncharacterized protein n=1 Tax=Stereum hirsutum (strain FP-91666) TaxID=721885 RepID=R7RWQ3_STEHR|nr:uncharacterized protein STEHIDRAFT_163365 [Stereum hirsutum FP-91666 SS1]EIM79806.1 hypothetical protein STEHIDRAFT_163365 [Stereum hirsutum FP-91666 SS1]
MCLSCFNSILRLSPPTPYPNVTILTATATARRSNLVGPHSKSPLATSSDSTAPSYYPFLIPDPSSLRIPDDNEDSDSDMEFAQIIHTQHAHACTYDLKATIRFRTSCRDAIIVSSRNLNVRSGQVFLRNWCFGVGV